jgi:3-hydroxybutyryl-CoA dehydrogenase
MGLERIAVIGAGLMGHGIAQVFAAHGHPVSIVDNNEDSLNTVKDRICTNLATMAAHGVELSDGIDAIAERVYPTANIEAACKDVAFVIEAVFEDMALKKQVFAELDRLCPPTTVLCSNTSVMSITEIASKSQHRERIVGTHFWNPPHLIPLVEVVRTQHTADWCIDATYELLQRVGKHPVRVHRDVPGFVGNRLQHALWREAFAIIDEGICDAATVDEVIRNGFGLRLPILGPVENADMVGLDLTLAIHNYILPHINADPTPSKTLQAKAAQRQLGFKSGSGFLEWSEEEMATSRERLANYLLDALAQRQADSKKRR